MEDGTNHHGKEDETQHERPKASDCSQESTERRSQATFQVYDKNSKSKQEADNNEGKMIESTANGTTTTATTPVSSERKIVKSLLVELHKFGKWQPPGDRPAQVGDNNAKLTTELAAAAVVAKASVQSPRLRQINIVGQLNHSAFRGMLTTCMSVFVILLGALLVANRPPHVDAAIWKSIFTANPSLSSSSADGGSSTPAALKLPLVVSHLMASANSATNPLASLGNSIWPISSSLKSNFGSSSSPTSGAQDEPAAGGSGKSRAARQSDPGDLQRGVALGHESANGHQQQAPPVTSQQFHYFWNHDHIDQKTMTDEAQKILADAQQQTDQIALGADRRRDTPTTSSSQAGNLSATAIGDQMATAASGEYESAQVAQVPPFIQQQLTSMVLHLQRQAQLSNMMQPRFGVGPVAPAHAQRRFESIASAPPSPAAAVLNPMARFWAASSSQHPVLALPPSSPPFNAPLFSQLTPSSYPQAPGSLDASAASQHPVVSQQLMQPRASLAGVPIYGPFMVAPTTSMATPLGPPSHSLHLAANLPHAANRQAQSGSRKRNAPTPSSGSRQSSASSRLASTLFGRHRKGGWFGTGGQQQQVAAASGPRPTIVLPPPPAAGASLAAEAARSLAASLPPESLALIEAASSQLANIIMNQMQARSAQQQQQHKMAIAAATAAALATRVQHQQQQQQHVDSPMADQMQLAASAPVGQQQQPQPPVDSQQLFELGSATVHGLSSLQPPYLLNAAQNLLAGPRGAAIANSLLGQYNQAMSMMQPAQVLELARLGLPIQLGAFTNTTATEGGGLQFGSRLRRRQVVGTATPTRSFRHAPADRPHQAAASAPYASPRPAASFDEQSPAGAAQVTFDRETGLSDQSTTATTPGGATETGSSYSDLSDDFSDSQAGGELTRSTLAPIARTTTPVVLAGESAAGSARRARQLQPQQQQVAARSIKPRNVLMPREPINMRQIFVHSKQVAALNAAYTPVAAAAPTRTGRSLGTSTGRVTRPLLMNSNHLTPAASELFETVTHDSDQNQLRRLKRSTSGWKSIDKTAPGSSSQSDWASGSSSWQSHDDIRRVEPTASSIMLKRQAELVGTGNATGSGQQQVVVGASSPGEASKRQDRAYKVKRITASASVMHHSQQHHAAARQHPIAKLAVSSGGRGKSTSSQFVPMQTVVGVKATPPSTSQPVEATAAAATVAHVKQHSATSGGTADSLAIDPMAASLSESARVVNYFANVENDTPPPAPPTTTSTTRAPQPVQQIAATSMYQSQHSATPPVMPSSLPGQVPQINVGFAAPKVQRAVPLAAVGTQGHAHASGNSGGSAGSSHGSVAASSSFHTLASAKQRQQQQQQNNQPANNLKSLPVPAGNADISSAATGNHAYAVQQSAVGNAPLASQDAGGQQQRQQHFGSHSGNQMLAGQQQQQQQQQLAQQAAFNARQLPQLATAASAHTKQTLLDNSLVNRNNLINTLLSMSPKSAALQQQQPVSQQSQQVANKQQNLNSMDRSPMADQSNQYHDQILAPSGQQQQQSQSNGMGGPPLGLYGAQMLGGDTSTGGGDQTTSGNNQQYQAYMEMNVNSGGQSMAGGGGGDQQQQQMAGDNRVESMIQQQQMQANEQQQNNLQQGQMYSGGAQDFGVRNSAAASSQQQMQQQQQQSSDLNLSEQSQMELNRFNNQQQLTSQQVAQLASQQQQQSSDQSSQSDQFGTSGANVIQDALDGGGSLTATEATNNHLLGNGGELKWTTGSDQQQQQLLEAQSQSLVNDAPSAQLTGGVGASDSGAQLPSSNWPAALQAALASSQQSTRLNMQLEDAMAVRNALLQSQIQQYNQQSSQQSPAHLSSSGAVDRNFFSSSGPQQTSATDQTNQLLLAQSGIEEEAANAAAAAAGIPSYPSAAQLLAIQAHGSHQHQHHQQMSPLATAGALQMSRPQDFMSHQSSALLMAGSEKRESGGNSSQGKRGKLGNGGSKKGPNKKGDLKHISHHYHFNSLGSPLEDPDNPLLTTSQLDFAGQIAANEQVRAEKLARQKRKQKEQEKQQQEEEQSKQAEEAEQKPKKKGFLRRFSIKNFFKRFRKDKQQQKEHAQQQQQSEDSQSADGGSDEQQSSGGSESSGSSERAAGAARAA